MSFPSAKADSLVARCKRGGVWINWIAQLPFSFGAWYTALIRGHNPSYWFWCI